VALKLVIVAVPIGLVPLKNVTVPVGLPEPGAVTEMIAVKVACRPFCEKASMTAVLALLTTTGKALLADAAKLASPLYAAEME
jgi:hypothetical protein